jgi:23S rRNA pseudouridine955/2504/2580 synthase
VKEIQINNRECGQRLDRMLQKYFRQATSGFLYKMLRKKNITLNGKKAGGGELLAEGDRIQVYFSEETFEKFRTPERTVPKAQGKLSILYEDEHILLINKPVGMLSQKADPKDVSAVEEITAYLLHTGQLDKTQLQSFHPGICNRLDRNTSGILAAGKTLTGLQAMHRMFAERSLHKYYLCPVFGILREPVRLEGYMEKDTKTNKVTFRTEAAPGRYPVQTRICPVEHGKSATLLEVELITGKSHQIRAHLAADSHGIFGDFKYGDLKQNKPLKEKFGLTHQLLHAYRLEFPELSGPLSALSQKTIQAPVPEEFKRIWDAYKN